jgi:N-ethylmaleimide reductase
MAPMTRSRAIGNIPNKLMEEYYKQRADAGLIITEGTTPSPNGFGYFHIPGIYSEAQVDGWKKITDVVHSKEGKMFIQLIHIGRISRHTNLPEDAVIITPSEVKLTGQMWACNTEQKDFPVTEELILEEIKHTRQQYISAAAKALKAGFDGIELHCDNQYMFEQFISPINRKGKNNNNCGIENRCHFLLEVIEDVIKVVGKDKVGLCLSPYGVTSNMPIYPEIIDTYKYLASRLNSMGILYIHLVDQNFIGAPELPIEIKKAVRSRFEHTVILSGGYTMERAEEELQNGLANLVAFGRPFINNPDLVQRFTNGWPLSKELDMSTFYSLGEKGYIDYPVYAQLSN